MGHLFRTIYNSNISRVLGIFIVYVAIPSTLVLKLVVEALFTNGKKT